MSTITYLVGDVFERLAELPDGHVDLLVTSPPFLALRSYLPDDHPSKDLELGSEPTPEAFIDMMLALTAEWRRVLAPHGTICVELGDTYAGSGGAGGDYDEDGMREGQPRFKGSGWHRRGQRSIPYRKPGTVSTSGTSTAGPGWPMDKSLAMIPESYRWALAYGRNPFNGEESPAGRWKVRNNVRWCRPNPPVGSLGDKYRPGTSDMVIATIDDKRYFDLDAVREPPGADYSRVDASKLGRREFDRNGTIANHTRTYIAHPAGVPPLDFWVISTMPYRGSHYATYPPELVRRPVQSMCPERVCVACGKPSRRILGDPIYTRAGKEVTGIDPWPWGGNEKGKRGNRKSNDASLTREAPTLGWTECGCGDDCVPTTWKTVSAPVLDEDTGEPVLNDSGKPKMKNTRVVDEPGICNDPGHWRPGLVLDPFGGSGTTGITAASFDRNALLIDLDEENLALARQRFNDRAPFDKEAYMHIDRETEVAPDWHTFEVSVRGRAEVANIESGQIGLFA